MIRIRSRQEDAGIRDGQPQARQERQPQVRQTFEVGDLVWNRKAIARLEKRHTKGRKWDVSYPNTPYTKDREFKADERRFIAVHYRDTVAAAFGQEAEHQKAEVAHANSILSQAKPWGSEAGRDAAPWVMREGGIQRNFLPGEEQTVGNNQPAAPVPVVVGAPVVPRAQNRRRRRASPERSHEIRLHALLQDGDEEDEIPMAQLAPPARRRAPVQRFRQRRARGPVPAEEGEMEDAQVAQQERRRQPVERRRRVIELQEEAEEAPPVQQRRLEEPAAQPEGIVGRMRGWFGF